MITMIETLIAKGFAYAAEGHVLFHVKSHTGYGTLSGAKQDDMLAGARIDVAPYKKDPFDFVLWKPSDITQDVPGWESPWGFGRPGWHIECSAMAAALLDVPFDIHGGGQDLLFPHHENEIAQSCAAHGTSHLARYWMHNGILMVEGQKMSKSLGNIITVDDLLQRIPGEVIRFMIIGTHYRATLDWTDVGVVGAKQSLDRLYNALQQAGDLGGEGSIDERFQHALNDDLNTPLAISVLHDIASAIFKENDTDARKILGQTLKTSAAVLGILNDTPQSWFQGDGDAQIAKLIEVRGQARVAKNFAESDRVRDLLLAQGIVLEDTPKGTTWRRL
jgi:cysteinyl-tRNA synthetase